LYLAEVLNEIANATEALAAIEKAMRPRSA
jgi:hypothetical protein